MSFSFVDKTGLPWKIVRKIAEYLPLNDAINAFSINILPLLNHPQAKFHLSNSCDPFIKKILPKVRSEQIVSLESTASQMWTKAELDFLSRFKEVNFISLRNLQYSYGTGNYMKYFPNLTCLCLYFDNKVDYIKLINIIRRFQHQLKRLEIHCPGLFIPNINKDQSTNVQTVKINAKYFLLDIGRYSSTPTHGIRHDYESSFCIARAAFMKEMRNIKFIHIITNSDDTAYISDEGPWRCIVKECSKLKKIRIEVCGNTSQNEQFLTKKALELQTALSDRRKKSNFKLFLYNFNIAFNLDEITKKSLFHHK